MHWLKRQIQQIANFHEIRIQLCQICRRRINLFRSKHFDLIRLRRPVSEEICDWIVPTPEQLKYAN